MTRAGGSLAVAVTLFASACSSQGTDELALDQEAAEAIGKGDAPTDIVRLDRVTPNEIADRFTLSRGQQITECFEKFQELYPQENAEALDDEIAARFLDVALRTSYAFCPRPHELSEIVVSILEDTDMDQLLPEDLVGEMPLWVEGELADASVTGFVDIEKAPLMFYDDIREQQYANAQAREQDPAGVSLLAIRENWFVIEEHSEAATYLNPVTFPAGTISGPNLFRYLRASFPLRGLSLVSTRSAAISDFAESYQGPDGTEEWSDIADMLAKPSIKKRFFFQGGGDEWTSSVLVLIDEHGQAWGLQMGYSE